MNRETLPILCPRCRSKTHRLVAQLEQRISVCPQCGASTEVCDELVEVLRVTAAYWRSADRVEPRKTRDLEAGAT